MGFMGGHEVARLVEFSGRRIGRKRGPPRNKRKMHRGGGPKDEGQTKNPGLNKGNGTIEKGRNGPWQNFTLGGRKQDINVSSVKNTSAWSRRNAKFEKENGKKHTQGGRGVFC